MNPRKRKANTDSDPSFIKKLKPATPVVHPAPKLGSSLQDPLKLVIIGLGALGCELVSLILAHENYLTETHKLHLNEILIISAGNGAMARSGAVIGSLSTMSFPDVQMATTIHQKRHKQEKQWFSECYTPCEPFKASVRAAKKIEWKKVSTETTLLFDAKKAQETMNKVLKRRPIRTTKAIVTEISQQGDIFKIKAVKQLRKLAVCVHSI